MPDPAAPQRRSNRISSIVHPAKRTREDDDSGASSSDSDPPSESESDAEIRPVKKTKRSRTTSTTAKSSKKANKTKKPSRPILEEAQEEDNDEAAPENYLFDALLDTEASIESLIADLFDSYQESAVPALADLVNCMLRCCGIKTDITTFDIEDIDTVEATVAQLQDHVTGRDRDIVKLGETYPLVSKDKRYRGIKKQLTLFFDTLVRHAYDNSVIFEKEDTSMFKILEGWLLSMSSSALRSLRHTSTTITLILMTGMIDIVVNLEKDLAIAEKQLSTEQKKKKQNAQRVKTLEGALASKHSSVKDLKEMLGAYFDNVYSHRYRDIDAKIRGECCHELGIWMLKLPSVYFEGTYLRFLGWVLSDTSSSTRLEVLRTLVKLYGNDDYVSALRHFTQRFKARIVEMALQDAETSVRCAALHVLQKIRQRGFLEDAEITKTTSCIFDCDDKVREATKDIFHAVLSDKNAEILDNELDGADLTEDQQQWVMLKVLSNVLKDMNQEKADDSEESELDLSKDLTLHCPGRIQIAAISFLPGIAPDHNISFQTITDYLLFDSSSKSKDAAATFLSLDDHDEQILLELCIASAEISHKAHQNAKDSKKDPASNITSEQIMIQLPRLLTRFTSAQQLATVLQLPAYCDLTVFIQLRKTAELEALLDRISKIFFSYTEQIVLNACTGALLSIVSTSSLTTITKDKLLDIQDRIRNDLLSKHVEDMFLSLRQLENISLIEDCLLSFDDTKSDGSTLYGKLQVLMTQTSPVIRRLARNCLRNYFLWRIRQLSDTRFGLEQREIDAVLEKRAEVLRILTEQASKGDTEAAESLVEFEAVFLGLSQLEDQDASVVHEQLSDDIQQIMVKVLQKQAKRYAQLSHRKVNISDEISSDDSDDEENESRVLEAERKLCIIASEIVRAICCEKMKPEYSTIMLQNKGKLGPSYDAILRELKVV